MKYAGPSFSKAVVRAMAYKSISEALFVAGVHRTGGSGIALCGGVDVDRELAVNYVGVETLLLVDRDPDAAARIPGVVVGELCDVIRSMRAQADVPGRALRFVNFDFCGPLGPREQEMIEEWGRRSPVTSAMMITFERGREHGPWWDAWRSRPRALRGNRKDRSWEETRMGLLARLLAATGFQHVYFSAYTSPSPMATVAAVKVPGHKRKQLAEVARRNTNTATLTRKEGRRLLLRQLMTIRSIWDAKMTADLARIDFGIDARRTAALLAVAKREGLRSRMEEP